MTNRFVVADPKKCIGCRTCEIACVVSHSDTNIFEENSKDIQFNPRLTVIKTARISAPVQCRQCEDSNCAKVCPVDAIKNEDGCLIVDEKLCIGCKTCTMACPYGLIELVTQYKEGKKVYQDRLKRIGEEGGAEDKERIIANKCDLCQGRGQGPACMEVCPTSALKIVKHEDIS